jgi:Uma2 family endonuclease
MKILDKKIWTYEQIDEIPEHSIVLNGKEVEIMASGKLHSRWVGKIYKRLDDLYDTNYWLFTNEIGILINKNPLLVLSSDIALVSRKKLKSIDTKILEIPPDLVVEIEKEKEEIDIEEKINYYSSIGIKKQIWVLLSRREVIVIEDDKRSIYSFDDEIELLEGKKIKFSDIEKEVIS